MSFSSDVKDELYEVYPKARHCQIAETAGIASILARMEPESGSILIETENKKILDKFFTLLYQTIKIDRGDGTKLNPTEGKKLTELLKTDGSDFTVTDEVVIEQDCCRRSFLRGIFLAAGSVSDPNKSYHFEIACHTMQQAEEVRRLIGTYECDARIVERKGHYVVYLKEGSQIVTMLGIIGAPKALMDFENIRILKEMRENVNRQVNCETSNIRKSVSAAVRQIEDIRYIQESGHFPELGETLQEAARLRLENPDMPLYELGQKCSPPVGKSGINHRLRKIGQVACDLRNQEDIS
ncbi:MAG: DNA-binding protein WhiA [Candidatus Weimeria sp.]